MDFLLYTFPIFFLCIRYRHIYFIRRYILELIEFNFISNWINVFFQITKIALDSGNVKSEKMLDLFLFHWYLPLLFLSIMLKNSRAKYGTHLHLKALIQFFYRRVDLDYWMKLEWVEIIFSKYDLMLNGFLNTRNRNYELIMEYIKKLLVSIKFNYNFLEIKEEWILDWLRDCTKISNFSMNFPLLGNFDGEFITGLWEISFFLSSPLI